MTDAIEAVEARLIESPIRAARSQGSGSVSKSVRRIIVRVATRDGAEGWGEAAPWAPFGNTAETTLVAIVSALRPALLGGDPAGIAARMQDCAKAIAGHPEAKAAVEMALWDIAGKRAGMPLVALLGGAVTSAIPLSFSIADPDFAADLDRAKAMWAEGHRIFKVKTGFAGHAEDLRRLEALRAALPRADLRVDYNQGLAPLDAIRTLRDIEAFRPTFIEQPVPRGQEAVMTAIAAALDTPLMADESIFNPAEMLAGVHARIADCVSIKLMKCGGIGPARTIDAIAGTAGWATYGGTLWEGGIALAAASHFIAASPHATLGCEFYMPSLALVEDVATGMTAGAGTIRLPPGPGLGVTLDQAVIRRQTVADA